MKAYIARRLLLFIPTVLGLTVLVFIIMNLVPGDIAVYVLGGESGEVNFTQEEYDDLRARFGLDKPLMYQYWDWISGLFTLDMGKALSNSRPIFPEFKRRVVITAELAFLAWITASLIGIPVGVISAVSQDSPLDFVARLFSIVGMVMPTFWVGLLVVILLSRVFNWFPPVGVVNIWDDPLTNLKQYIWPALALGYSINGLLGRMTRNQLLEVLREDYIRTAMAKGLHGWVVVFRHALKNAMLPVVTLSGIQLASLLGGTVVIEQIFSLPGLGRFLIDSINRRDLIVIQNVVLFIGIIFVSMNLIVDLIYGWIDPRIRYS